MPATQPNHPPIVGFVPWTPERVVVVRDARAAAWLAEATSPPKRKSPSSTTPKKPRKSTPAVVIPSNLPPELQAQIAEALRRMK